MQTRVSHSFDFCDGGNADQIKISGWSSVEANHTWNEGPFCSVVIDGVDAPFGFFLELDWWPFITHPYRLEQNVIIAFGRHRLRPHRLMRRELSSFYCPPIDPSSRRTLISWEFPDAIPATEFPGTSDPRALSAAFMRLRILPLLAPYPQRVQNGSVRRTRAEGAELVAETDSEIARIGIEPLLRQFEVIAGNCDLGLAARTIGFEQLSLLRFAGAPARVAVDGIETDFARTGENLSAYIADNPIKEWMLSDASGLRFHSHQSSEAMTESHVIERQRLHIQFLKRKFLEDLAEAEKIFVYSAHLLPNNVEEALSLFLALNRQRPTRMVWVCQNTRETEPNRVDEIVPGLARGSLDYHAGPLEAGHISVSSWLNVLFNTSLVLNRQEAEALIKTSAKGSGLATLRPSGKVQLEKDVWLSPADGGLAALLSRGWSSPESWGVWGVGESHELNVPVDATHANPAAIDLDVQAFLGPEASERKADIFFNGRRVAQFVFTPAKSRTTLTFSPVYPIKADGTVAIEFRPELQQPATEADAAAPKELGIGFCAIRLRAVAAS